MAGPWLVPVTSFRRSTGAVLPVVREGRLEPLRVADTTAGGDDPVIADVTLTSADGGIDVAATVATRWHSACRRCLRPVEGRLEVPVREVYRPAAARRGADDEETYELGTDHLDLEPLVRDAVLLALPLAPLCREDCAGLCPSCGADLSDGPCGCPTVAGDPRWAALDVLRLDPGGAPAPGRD